MKQFKIKKNKKRNPVGYVSTLPFKNQVLKVCDRRQDDWGEEVRLRTMACNDLVAAEARYHYNCNKRFSSCLKKETTNSETLGPPVVSECDAAFNSLCDWLETEAELYSLNELHNKMKELAGCEDVYTVKWFKTRLINKYKEHIF